MEKAYSRINWENEPSVATPINDVNLNKMDSGLNEIDNRVVALDETKAEESDMLLAINNVSFDANTGIFTFTRKNGTQVQMDTLLEKVVTNFEYIDDPDDPHYQQLKLTLKDGTVQYIDLSAFISIYEFIDTDTIAFSVVNGKVKADVINGSITADKLQPNYLADIIVQAQSAAASATSSQEKALISEGYAKGTQNGVPVEPDSIYYHNNAKYYSEMANVTSLAALTDVDINNPEDKQALVYDAESEKWINGDPVGGGILPKLIITTETGSTVTVTDGTTVLTPVEESGTWITELPNFGSWVVSSTNAQGTATNTVNVDTVKIYNVNVSHFTAHITVTFPEGATATAVNGSESYSSGTSPHTFDVHSTGTWTISATRDGETVSTTVNITTDGQTESVTLSMATILLTVDEDFMGDTVVLSDGNNTKTWVVNSTTHVFTVSFGTWTATITKSGSTYSSDPVTVNAYIQYEAYIASWNYAAWLESAGIADTFGSLEAVLESEPTLRILMTKHASADYMVSWCEADETIATQILDTDLVAKWVNLRDYCLDKVLDSTILATLVSTLGKYGYGEWALIDSVWQPKGAVPKMTSNSAPYGECGGTSYVSTADYYKAFAQVNTGETTCWTSNGSTNQRIYYKFVNPICAHRVYFENRNYSGDNNGRIKTFKVQASNDGSEWVDLTDAIVRPDEAGTTAKYPTTVEVNNSNYYRYYAILGIDLFGASTNKIGLSMLQFYGRQLSVSVPKMTSNTAPWGEASASNVSSGHEAYKAFDKTDANLWATSGTTQATLSYHFASEIIPQIVYIKPENKSGICLKDFKIEGSNDGSNWTELYSGTFDSSKSFDLFDISDTTSYKYLRLNALSSNKTWVGIVELDFYGLDYSEHEERHWIYDHGVELETVTSNGYSKSGNVVHPIIKENDGFIVETPSTNNHVGLGGTDESIDLSDYSFLKSKTYSITNTPNAQMCVDTTKVNDDTYVAKVEFPSQTLGGTYDWFINVSSIMANEYLYFRTYGNGTAQRYKVLEWWLE